jgi:hypothetical protein
MGRRARFRGRRVATLRVAVRLRRRNENRQERTLGWSTRWQTAVVRRFHSWLTRWLWGRAGLLAVGLAVGWITGDFYTGLTVALILFVAFFVGSGLLVGSMQWRVGKSFAAKRGRVLTTLDVMENGWPILLVKREEAPSRGWRFVHEEDDLRTALIRVHIQQVLERDPSIAGISSLRPGSRAWRSTEDDAWVVEPVGRNPDQRTTADADPMADN